MRDRRPMLAAVLQLARRAAARGEPFDLIAGDFNAPSRSVGFDAYATAGFTNAASFSSWRATPYESPVTPEGRFTAEVQLKLQWASEHVKAVSGECPEALRFHGNWAMPNC